MADSKAETVEQITQEWLRSRVRKGQLARNTVAIGLVILDRLREKCPLKRSDVLTSGGEIKGARSGLRKVLEKYSLPEKYLKEATTRQAQPDGIALLEQLRYGSKLSSLRPADRDEQLLRSIQLLLDKANEWLQRQHLKVSCNRQLSPATWIRLILQEAKGKSGGEIEQHLVGAKLQTRLPEREVPNYPAHAGDVQTGRSGDFDVDSISYHVTATPGRDVIEKCRANAAANRHPVLVVPGEQVLKAKHLAEDEGINDRVTILALEDFVAQNVIEISIQHGRDFYSTLQQIIAEYNRRVEEAETDMALKIELL